MPTAINLQGPTDAHNASLTSHGLSSGVFTGLDAAVNPGASNRFLTAAEAAGGTSLTDYTNVVVVDSGGKGDYTTLAAALAAITNDDASHIYNVFVFGVDIDYSLVVNRPYINVIGRQKLPYKVYSALLSQSGVAAPVATVLQNTIGDIIWTRDVDGGVYYGTLAGAFPYQKVIPLAGFATSSDSGNTYLGKLVSPSDGNVVILTHMDIDYGQLGGDGWESTPIEIKVYP
jgi:hypothetical protein